MVQEIGRALAVLLHQHHRTTRWICVMLAGGSASLAWALSAMVTKHTNFPCTLVANPFLMACALAERCWAEENGA